MDDEAEKTVQMEISITDDVKKGVYSNGVSVSHTNTDFYLDFLTTTEHPVPMGAVVSRVFLAPLTAKKLLKTLTQMVESYETQFALIPDDIKPKKVS